MRFPTCLPVAPIDMEATYIIEGGPSRIKEFYYPWGSRQETIRGSSWNRVNSHTNLNSESWYIRENVARVLYAKVLTLLNGTVQTMHLSVYSTISNVLQIGVKLVASQPTGMTHILLLCLLYSAIH